MIITAKNNILPKAIIAIAAVITAAITGVALLQDTSQAADLSKFDPGNIMSDTVMSNKNSMNVQQIQTFLDSKNPCNNTNIHMASWYPNLKYTIKDGKFVCMAKDTFDGQSAAQIIWQVSQDYGINPQFLIVLLEKEQGLITDTWPNHRQYQTATGFGCPDTAACDSKYFGLKNQLQNAASLFRTVLNGGWSNYPVGNTYVQYHPNSWCGGTVVNIQNRATSALYRYTPYQPNPSALAAGYGSGDACGAYGNRNTYALFTDWFGDPTTGVYLDILKATQDIEDLVSHQNLQMGLSASGVVPEYGESPRVWQSYENGVVIWTTTHGAQYVPYGTTYKRWQELGGSSGVLGTPTSQAILEKSDGRVWQNFKKGLIVHTVENGGWEIVPGPIGDKWHESGGSSGQLRRPVSSVMANSNGNRFQKFEGGQIVRESITSPAYTLLGPIDLAWSRLSQTIGNPVSDTITESNGHTWQTFKNGLLVKSSDGTAWPVLNGDFYARWQKLGGSFGLIGRPSSNQVTEANGRTWQFYEKGLLVRKSNNSITQEILFGPLYDRWQSTGGSSGPLGTPQGSSYKEGDGRTWQYFESGVIIQSEHTGAWEVEGNFYGYWKEHGGSTGSFGKPTGQKNIEPNGDRWQSFEKGKILWSPQKGWFISKL